MPGTCNFEKRHGHASLKSLSADTEYDSVCTFGYRAFQSLSFDSPCKMESYFHRFKLATPMKKQLHCATHIKIMTVIYLSENCAVLFSFIQIYGRLFPKITYFCKSTLSARISSHQNMLDDESLQHH